MITGVEVYFLGKEIKARINKCHHCYPAGELIKPREELFQQQKVQRKTLQESVCEENKFLFVFWISMQIFVFNIYRNL